MPTITFTYFYIFFGTQMYSIREVDRSTKGGPLAMAPDAFMFETPSHPALIGGQGVVPGRSTVPHGIVSLNSSKNLHKKKRPSP